VFSERWRASSLSCTMGLVNSRLLGGWACWFYVPLTNLSGGGFRVQVGKLPVNLWADYCLTSL